MLKTKYFSNLFTFIKEPLGILILVTIIYFRYCKWELLSEVIVIGLIIYRLAQKTIEIQNNWRRLNESSAGVNIEKIISQLRKNKERNGNIRLKKLEIFRSRI